MNKKYKITDIGSVDSYYGNHGLIGMVGCFRFAESHAGGYIPPNGFSVGTFFPDKGGNSFYFCAVQLEEVKENEMIINIDGVKLEGAPNEMYNILEKLGLKNKLNTYTSSSKGKTLICGMDTEHIRNALLKMWRECPFDQAKKARNIVSQFLADELDSYLSEYTNSALVQGLRSIQPMIPNVEFHYLLLELETREDED